MIKKAFSTDQIRNWQRCQWLVYDLILFVIFKVLIVSFTCGDGDMRVAVTKFIPVVFDFKEKFGNLPFTFTGLQEANSLLLR